jgi:hypothetical protein
VARILLPGQGSHVRGGVHHPRARCPERDRADLVLRHRTPTWKVPEGWEPDPQTAAVVDTGAHEGYVVAAPISLIPKSNAPRVIAVAPGPAVDTKIAGYGSAPEYDMVVLDAAAGHPSGISKGSTRRP